MAPSPSRPLLDQRRGWARRRAVVVALTGIGVIALAAAVLMLILIAAAARFWTWMRTRDIDSAGILGFAGEAAIATAIGAVAVSFAIVFWWFWRGSIDVILREVRATRVEPSATSPGTDRHQRTANLLEELSIGLGRPVPELWATDDPTPNALSSRSSTRRAVCVSSGVDSLPRDELEALLAHEMGHLWASDAQWVSSGMVALGRGRRAGLILFTCGAMMLFVVFEAATSGDLLWGTGLIAVALTVLGSIATPLLRRLEVGMRRNADVIADVCAVNLARNPGSLAALCARLADDHRVVTTAGWRTELLWFEMAEAPDLTGELDPEAPQRTRRELVVRAIAAYAEAGTPVPEEFRQRFESWVGSDEQPSNPTDRSERTGRTDPPPPSAPKQSSRPEETDRQRRKRLAAEAKQPRPTRVLP